MDESNLPAVRLRDALKFFDELPPETKAEFDKVRQADHFVKHFGFGMFLRNKLLWKSAIGVLTSELQIVREGYEQGTCDFNLREIELAADAKETPWFCEHDSISLELLDVLDRRYRGEIRIADPI